MMIGLADDEPGSLDEAATPGPEADEASVTEPLPVPPATGDDVKSVPPVPPVPPVLLVLLVPPPPFVLDASTFVPPETIVVVPDPTSTGGMNRYT